MLFASTAFPMKLFRIVTITELITASQEILTLLGVVVFFFSALGMQLWGGTLYKTHPALEGGSETVKRFKRFKRFPGVVIDVDF